MPGFCRQLHSLSCTKGMTLIQCVDDTLSSAVVVVVVVTLLFYVHGKHLKSCRDGQLT